MRRWISLCACILALLVMPFAGMAAVVGDENATATPGNETGQMDNLTENVTIAAYIGGDENLTMLAEALNATGLYDILDSGGPYTVFAPSNEAFDALGNETVNRLLNETDNLTLVLQYHVVEGEYTSENLTGMAGNQTGSESGGGILDIFSGLIGAGNQTGNETTNVTGNMTTLKTLGGEDLNVTVSDGEIMVGDANVTTMDITTTNGVIHIIDRVLVPASVNLTVAGNETVTPTGTMETVTPTETMA